MRKRQTLYIYIVASVLLFVTQNIYSQQSSLTLDSLWTDYLNSLEKNDEGLTEKILTDLNSLASTIEDDSWEAASYTELAKLYEKQGYLGKAATNFFKSIDLLHNNSDQKNWLADNYNDLSSLYRASGNYKQAIEYVNMAIQLYGNDQENSLQRTIAYRNKSIYLLDQEKLDSARAYAELGLSLAKRENFTNEIPLLYNTIGTILFQAENKDEAIKAYVSGLQATEDSSICTIIYHNLGELYFSNKQIDLASRELFRSLNLNQNNDNQGLALKRSTYYLLAKLHLTNSNKEQAITYLEKSITVDTVKLIDEEENVYKGIILLSKTLGGLQEGEATKINKEEALIRCNNYMLQYLDQLQMLKDRLGILNKQYIVNFAAEKHVLSKNIANAEAKRAQIWQAFWIPVVFTVLLLIGFLYMVSRLKKARRFVSEIDFLMED